MISLLKYLDEKSIIEAHGEHDKMLQDFIDSFKNEISRDAIEQIFKQDKKLKNKNQCLMFPDFFLWHFRLKDISDFKIRVVIPKEKDSIFGGRKKIYLIILIPENFEREYLSFLAHLSRYLKLPEVKKAFLEHDKDKIIRTIRDFEK